MPPLPSDEENGASSGEEEIPYRGKEAKAPQEAAAEDESDDEDAGEDEYVVEKILSHKSGKGEILYKVKWAGWDDPKDYTWEPESNLDTAPEALYDYWDEIGGRPELKSAGKKRGRASTGGKESKAATPASTKKQKKELTREKEWSPPPGSWENEVDEVETVMENLDPKTGKLKRFALVHWANQKKTQHPLHQIYQKCPQKMLQYYESHLVFTQQDDETNGDDADMAF